MKIVRRKVSYKTKFLEFITTNYINMKKKPAQWFWCRRPNAQKAVVIVAVKEFESEEGEKFDKLIVIREYRVPIEGYQIGFPAGLIDEGETPEDAVRRELEEETGLKVEKIMHISPPVLSSAGLTDESVHMAYVRVSGEPNTDKLEASEDIETFLLDQDEITALMLHGEEPIGKSSYCVMRNFSKFGEI